MLRIFDFAVAVYFGIFVQSSAALEKIKGPLDGYVVTQVHISQGTTPESMTISWLTATAAQSQVKYGLKEDQLSSVAEGESTSYNYTYFSQPTYYSGIIHHVTLTNLHADTKYYYQCGDFSTETTSGLLTFTTLPKVGDHRSLSFGVIGDLGQTEDSESTLSHIENDNTLQLILHAGDLSYADCMQPLWDSYGEMIEDLSRERPWMVGPGNHEIEINDEGSLYQAFQARYRMPQVKPAEYGQITIPPGVDSAGHAYCASSVFQSEYNYGNSFYSFETGSAHIIYLNPYSTTSQDSAQYKWLVEDLAKINRDVTPWIIVVMHCPWYSSNQAHYGEKQTTIMRDSFEPIFYKNHVNLVLAGHVHAYERSYPIYQNQTVSNGIVYVTIGDAGNREGHASSYYAQPSWSAFRNGTQYGYASINLVNKEKLVWRWHRNIDGNIVSKDEMILCNSAFTDTLCSFSSI